MTPTPPPSLFDRARVAQNRDRASSNYEQYAFLKVRESNQLLDRLADVSRTFPRALDLGAHDGTLSRLLLESDQVEAVTAFESSPKFATKMRLMGLEAIQGDEDKLPFEPQCFELVASVLALHWVNDLPGALVQARTVLKPDGLFLGCLFGGGTLTELRTALIEAESELTGGISPRLSPLPGLQDMAALMQRTGFALPVVDQERVTVRYDHPMKLLRDLKGMGEQAAFAPREGQARRPLSSRLLARMSEIYRHRFSDLDGKVRATFEIIWLSGWAPAAGQPKPLRPGSGKFSLAQAVKKAGES